MGSDETWNRTYTSDSTQYSVVAVRSERESIKGLEHVKEWNCCTIGHLCENYFAD